MSLCPPSPPSTAMTLGFQPAEAECLLEERRGGDTHTPSHTRCPASAESPRKNASVPDELVGRGHSRTSSYASQQSKISGTHTHTHTYTVLMHTHAHTHMHTHTGE